MSTSPTVAPLILAVAGSRVAMHLFSGPRIVLLAVAGSRAALHLFSGPRIVVGERLVDVPEGSKRLLVFLALQRRNLERGWLAGMLWPDGENSRAMGNLRSSLWRLKRANVDILEASKWTIKLRDDISTDIEGFDQWAARLINHAPREADLKIPPCLWEALDFLPAWPEDWLIMERERLRHRALCALESLSSFLSDMGRSAEAVEAATIAVCADPLRDSAQRTLIDAHVAQGNIIEARRRCDNYIATIRRELGVGPPPYLLALRSQIGATGPSTRS